MSNFIRKRIDEIAEVTKLAGFEFTKFIEYIPNGEIIAIRALNLKNGQLVLDDVRRIDRAVSDSLPRSRLYKNDIVISYTGTVGEAAQIEENNRFHLAPNVAKITPLKDKVNPQYLFYYIRSYEFKQQMLNYAHGSTQMTVPMKVIRELSVPIPPRIEQERIVSILEPIYKKIKENEQINNNLEEQAVVLFRSWFSAFSLSPNSPRVNSEFGEIPEDFAVVKVGSLPMLVTDYVANGSFASLKANVNLYQEPNYAYFIRNTDLKSGSFGVFVDQHSYEFLSKSTLYGGEIIISNVGDVGSVFLCPKLDGRMTLGNNIIMLRPEDDHLRYYLYIWFKYFQGQALIQGIKGGSAQPKFNKTDFKNTSVLIPPKDILTRFHETVAPMFETISQRQAETSHLVDLRDTLLPQLMSGEIDVSNLDL